jgi:hypothetical protein
MTMAVTVTGLFASRDDAERAAAALMDHGVDREEISLVTRGEEAERAAERRDADERPTAPHEGITTTTAGDAATGAAAGAGIGAALGLLAGAATLFVPGFGLITAAGPLAWALGGAVGTAAAGAVAGGVFGGLRDMGADDHAVRDYEEGLRQGSTFLSARSDEFSAAEMREILAKYNATSVRDYAGAIAMGPSTDVTVEEEVVVTHPDTRM